MSVGAGLSQLLVAFTIEFDDLFEQRMPHRTSRGPAAGSGRGPWLVSRAMWANALRWIPDDGMPAREFRPLAELTNLAGLQRWGYLTVDDEIVRLARGGTAANWIWGGLTAEVEQRWSDRFGASAVERLRAELWAALGSDLPWALPVIGRVSTTKRLRGWSSPVDGSIADFELPTLLARALMASARRIESSTFLPVQFGANALRVISDDGIPRAQVAARAGISREAASLSITLLTQSRLIDDGPTLRITERGREIQELHRRLREEADAALPAGVADAVSAMIAQTDALSGGLRPHDAGWRTDPRYRAQTQRMVDDPVGALPWFPMVLHRGGYPDGS